MSDRSSIRTHMICVLQQANFEFVEEPDQSDPLPVFGSRGKTSIVDTILKMCGAADAGY